MIAKVRNQTLDSFAGLGVVTHDTMAEYEALICKNLGITHDELEDLIKAPGHQHYEYKTENDSLSFIMYNAVRNIRRKVKYGKV